MVKKELVYSANRKDGIYEITANYHYSLVNQRRFIYDYAAVSDSILCDNCLFYDPTCAGCAYGTDKGCCLFCEPVQKEDKELSDRKKHLLEEIDSLLSDLSEAKQERELWKFISESK